MFRTFYRISDIAHPLGMIEYDEIKQMLGGDFSRKECFENALSVFDKNNMTIMADNISDETFEFIKTKGVQDIVRTSFETMEVFS